jgi:hypothetical protein
MTLKEIEELWELARVIHEARRDLAWGPVVGPKKEKWPRFHRSYTHNPIAYVDLALASAKAVTDTFKIDLAA